MYRFLIARGLIPRRAPHPCEARPLSACGEGTKGRGCFQTLRSVLRSCSFLMMVITFLTIGIAQAQIISTKSIFGEVYSSEFVADASVDVIVKRLGNADSMAKIIDFVNKGGISKGFAKSGDASVFIPFYSNQKNRDYGIFMLTYFSARSEMRFTYEPMDGSYFFQDLYAFSAIAGNKTKVSFSKRYTSPEYQSQEFVTQQAHWVEECLARLKAMAEGK